MHQVFTKTNGIKAVLHFLTSQQNAVENWLRANSDPAINHVIREEKHPIFGRQLSFEIVKHGQKYLKTKEHNL